MKVEEIIYDVFEILNAIGDDRSIDELWLMQKINAYRAGIIQEEYKVTREINPIWLQRIRTFKFTKVNAADDPKIPVSSIQLGKFELPPVISLPDDQGLQRIGGSGAIRGFDPCDFNLLMLVAEMSQVNMGYGYYSKIGSVTYCWPYVMEGSAIIIAEDPQDVMTLNSSGNAMQASSITDSYPLDIANAQKIILMILTKELGIKLQTVSDVTNDAQDQFKIMNSGTAQARQ